MTHRGLIGAVLYAKDLGRLVKFYSSVAGIEPQTIEKGYAVCSAGAPVLAASALGNVRDHPMQVCTRHSAMRKLGIRRLGQLRIEGCRHSAPAIRGKAGAELCPRDIREVTGSLPRPADRGFRNTVHSLAHDGSSLVEKSKSAMPCLRTTRVTRAGDGIRHLNVTQVEDSGRWKASIKPGRGCIVWGGSRRSMGRTPAQRWGKWLPFTDSPCVAAFRHTRPISNFGRVGSGSTGLALLPALQESSSKRTTSRQCDHVGRSRRKTLRFLSRTPGWATHTSCQYPTLGRSGRL
jgi:hypothetical protein